MKKLERFNLALVKKLALMLLCLCCGQVAWAGDLKFVDVFARATPPGAYMGAIYGSIINTTDHEIRIIGIATPVAGLAELHQSIEIDGMMRMREIKPIVLAPNETMQLQPGGKHIMLMKLKSGLSKGQIFKLSISDEKHRSFTTEVLVGGFGQMDMPEPLETGPR